MNELSKRTVRKFNPGTFQPDEEVIRQFVVRIREFDNVLEILRGNIDSPSCQHILLAAPRGRGKSMLLARVAAELRIRRELSERLLPVQFMEESHEILTFADFWLETLFHLARGCATYDSGLSQELRKTHADLSARWREEEIAERARATVLETADRLGKKLVLMVENLQAISDDADGDFGWKLRNILQSEPQIMLLATATNRFRGLEDASQPFFELFRIVDLEPLDPDESRCLWKTISGDNVSEREIRPLQILTGGSPRLLVIVAEFARHRSPRQLMEDLVKLIDDHTEYFRGHLEALPKTERRVYLAVIDLWQPSTAAEVATRTRMDIRIVSSLLGRLVSRGAVAVEGRGRKRLYAAAERLYCIYYKLRRERDEAAVVRNLIRFMVAFYSGDELEEMFSTLAVEASRSSVIREGLERAMTESPQRLGVFLSVTLQGIKRIFQETATRRTLMRLVFELQTALEEQKLDRFIEIVDQFPVYRSVGSPQIPELLIAQLVVAKALAHRELGNSEGAIVTFDEVIERFGMSEVPELQVQVAIALINKGNVESQCGESRMAIATFDEAVRRFGGSKALELQVQVAMALVNRGRVEGQRGESEMAIATFDEVVRRFGTSDAPEIQMWVAWALNHKGGKCYPSKPEEALAAFGEVIKRFGMSDAPELQVEIARALVNRGSAEGQRGELEVALSTFDDVVRRFGTSDAPEIQVRVAKALTKRGAAEEQLGKLEKAIATYDEVVRRFGMSDAPELQAEVAKVLVVKADKQTRTGRSEEALRTCDELETRLSILTGGTAAELVWWAKYIRVNALLAQKKLQATMDAFRAAYAAFIPGNETTMRHLIQLIFKLLATGATPCDLLDILTADREKSDTLAPILVTLRQRSGETVRAPAEVLEVAADIHKRTES